MVDIARRVWNHKWKIDPIVRSLLDTDFYKLLMCQSIFRNKPDTSVTFSLINRNNNIKLAELIDEGELREQLDHIRSYLYLEVKAHGCEVIHSTEKGRCFARTLWNGLKH